MSDLALTYSLADQCFDQTKSLGVLRVSLELVQRLACCTEVTHLHILGNSSLYDQVPAAPRVAYSAHDAAMRGRVGRMLWDQFGVYTAAQRTGADLLFLPKGYASFLAPPGRVKLVAYVHDVLVYRYRQLYAGALSAFEQRYFLASLRATLRHASLIVTNSQFTTSEVKALAAEWKLSPPPVVTVGIGLMRDPYPQLHKEDRIIVLASRFPHKRTELAMQYLARWTDGAKFTGAIDWVGQLPPGASLPDRRGWRLHPRLPDARYKDLLRRAKALVYFSDYEGFGMPPAEAAPLGTAPVYSLIAATHEVMGGVGFPFENCVYESFAEAMTAAMEASPAAVLAEADSLLARHDWNAVTCRVTRALCAIAARESLPCP